MQWTQGCIYLFKLVCSLSSDIYPRVELLYYAVVLFLIFWGLSITFSNSYLHQQCMTVPFSPHANNHLLFPGQSTLEQFRGCSTDPLHSWKSAYNFTFGPPHPRFHIVWRIQPAADGVVDLCCTCSVKSTHMHKRGPVQFKVVLFRGPLSFW